MTYDDGCVGRCAYCGLNRRREVEPDKRTFIRVDWPTYQLVDIIARFNQDDGQLRRVGVGNNKEAFSTVRQPNIGRT